MWAPLRGELRAGAARVDTDAIRRPQLLRALLEWLQSVGGDGPIVARRGRVLPTSVPRDESRSPPTATHGEGTGRGIRLLQLVSGPALLAQVGAPWQGSDTLSTPRPLPGRKTKRKTATATGPISKGIDASGFQRGLSCLAARLLCADGPI